MTDDAFYEFLNLQKNSPPCKQAKNFTKPGPPGALRKCPATSASAQPAAATIDAMSHAHRFKLNNAAAFMAAADVRACTTKTTTITG